MRIMFRAHEAVDFITEWDKYFDSAEIANYPDGSYDLKPEYLKLKEIFLCGKNFEIFCTLGGDKIGVCIDNQDYEYFDRNSSILATHFYKTLVTNGTPGNVKIMWDADHAFALSLWKPWGKQ